MLDNDASNIGSGHFLLLQNMKLSNTDGAQIVNGDGYFVKGRARSGNQLRN